MRISWSQVFIKLSFFTARHPSFVNLTEMDNWISLSFISCDILWSRRMCWDLTLLVLSLKFMELSCISLWCNDVTAWNITKRNAPNSLTIQVISTVMVHIDLNKTSCVSIARSETYANLHCHASTLEKCNRISPKESRTIAKILIHRHVKWTFRYHPWHTNDITNWSPLRYTGISHWPFMLVLIDKEYWLFRSCRKNG